MRFQEQRKQNWSETEKRTELSLYASDAATKQEFPGKPNCMIFQLGWSTLPGLRGLSVSEFRATPTDTPDNERGVAIEFVNDRDRTAFLREIEAAFAVRRFTNAADAFDTVKAYALERATKRL